MIRFFYVFIFAVAVLAAGVALADPPNELYCDYGVYPPLTLRWGQCPDLQQVRGVYPHPLMPGRVVITTATGLGLSDDAGITWKPLPAASVDAVGLIQKVAFHPTDLDTFYLASKTKGVWVTTDAGTTFRQVGSKAGGMAADDVEDVIVYPADPSHQTLLAVHGTSAEGISRSRDVGKTWDVLSAGYNFHGIIAPERESREIFMNGSTKGEPEIQSLYYSSTPGEFAFEVIRDVTITDMAFAMNRKNSLYVATSDSGLYRVDNGQFTPEPKLLGKKDDSWSSVAVSWVPNADVLSLCLYNPSQLGLIFSTDDLATTRAYEGPPTGTFVKEGAAVRPNANGTIYYAAVNEGLMIGRPNAQVPAVTVKPAAFEGAADMRQTVDDLINDMHNFLVDPEVSTAKAAEKLLQKTGDLSAPYRHNQLTVTARLPLKPAPPVTVTADLSRFGGSPTQPLYDDGRHEDSAAGDGIYGFTFCYQPLNFPIHGEDWRPPWPGRVAIAVTATYASGSREGSVGVVNVAPEIESTVLWGIYHNQFGFTKDGDVTVETATNAATLHNGPTFAMKIHAGRGPWSVQIDTPPWGGGDITGYASLAFGLRLSDGVAPKELYMQLQDAPDLSQPTTTDRVAIIHDCAPGGTINADYRTVVVPFDKLLGKQITQFQTSRTSKIILSGDGGAPATLLMDWLSYLAPAQGAHPTK